jgi:short-chain fatty acids transporter
MTEQPGPVARAALALTNWTERWIPDAFIFALVATILVIGAALAATPATLLDTVDAWGRGFWDLIPFTLQMALVIITGHVLASSPPMGRLIRLIAGWPRTPRGAVALVAFFALASSWFNWGFSLVFSAVLAIEIARRVEGVDYRALAAASMLGLGSIWAQGLSGSAALQMATSGALQPAIRDIVSHGGMVPGGMIPFRHTIFLWQSFAAVGVEIVVVVGVMWLATAQQAEAGPRPTWGSTCRPQNVERRASTSNGASEPAGALPALVLRRALGGAISRGTLAADEPLNALNLNILNLVPAADFCCKTPRLMRAVQEQRRPCGV